MSRDILGKVNIRISNELFVGYPNIKIPENTSFKLFSTSNTDKSNIFNIVNKTNHNESMLDNLLSSILKYDKSFNKSKQKSEKNSKANRVY